MSQPRFLGRYFDERTHTWKTGNQADGEIPEERRQDLNLFIEQMRDRPGQGFFALGLAWAFKDDAKKTAAERMK